MSEDEEGESVSSSSLGGDSSNEDAEIRNDANRVVAAEVTTTTSTYSRPPGDDDIEHESLGVAPRHSGEEQARVLHDEVPDPSPSALPHVAGTVMPAASRTHPLTSAFSTQPTALPIQNTIATAALRNQNIQAARTIPTIATIAPLNLFLRPTTFNAATAGLPPPFLAPGTIHASPAGIGLWASPSANVLPLTLLQDNPIMTATFPTSLPPPSRSNNGTTVAGGPGIPIAPDIINSSTNGTSSSSNTFETLGPQHGRNSIGRSVLSRLPQAPASPTHRGQRSSEQLNSEVPLTGLSGSSNRRIEHDASFNQSQYVAQGGPNRPQHSNLPSVGATSNVPSILDRPSSRIANASMLGPNQTQHPPLQASMAFSSHPSAISGHPQHLPTTLVGGQPASGFLLGLASLPALNVPIRTIPTAPGQVLMGQMGVNVQLGPNNAVNHALTLLAMQARSGNVINQQVQPLLLPTNGAIGVPVTQNSVRATSNEVGLPTTTGGSVIPSIGTTLRQPSFPATHIAGIAQPRNPGSNVPAFQRPDMVTSQNVSTTATNVTLGNIDSSAGPATNRSDDDGSSSSASPDVVEGNRALVASACNENDATSSSSDPSNSIAVNRSAALTIHLPEREVDAPTSAPLDLDGTAHGLAISQHPDEAVSLSHPTVTNAGETNRSFPLCLNPEDDLKRVSAFQHLARLQIEVFEATKQEAATSMQGRNNPVVPGQVGIRCRHCANVPRRLRKAGCMYYPSKVSLL